MIYSIVKLRTMGENKRTQRHIDTVLRCISSCLRCLGGSRKFL